MKFRYLLTLSCFLGVAYTCQVHAEDKVENKDIEWHELEPTPDPTGVYKGLNTYAIIPQQLNDFPSGTQLHKSFILEKQNFLLGEPIMIELRTWLTGSGDWKEMNWVGDSHDFAFLMRHEDGEWVQHHQKIREPIDRGGGATTVTQNNAHQRWVLLQFSQAITRPGKYTVYCVFRNIGWSKIRINPYVKSPALPLFNHFSSELQEQYKTIEAEAKELKAQKDKWFEFTSLYDATRKLWRAEVYAAFSITIREGSEQEIESMVRTTVESLDKEGRSQKLKSDLTLIQQHSHPIEIKH